MQSLRVCVCVFKCSFALLGQGTVVRHQVQDVHVLDDWDARFDGDDFLVAGLIDFPEGRVALPDARKPAVEDEDHLLYDDLTLISPTILLENLGFQK